MKEKRHSLRETFSLAHKHFKEKNFQTAEILCKKILSVEPNYFDSIFLLATLSAINRNFEESKKLLNKAINIEPNNLAAHNNLGNIEKQLKNYQEAIKSYEKTIQIDPNHANAYFNLGILFYELKEFQKAINYFQKAVKIQPNYANAYFNLGNAHVEIKEFYKAISYYKKAIEINPDYIGAHNNLGLIFRGLNDFKNAISCYQKAIKIRPNHGGTHHNLALAFKEVGEFDKAISSHESGIKYEPENLIHYYYLSELKKDVLNSEIKSKIKKILAKENPALTNKAYGNFLLSKYENKIKNYKEELNYLIKGHRYFFETKKEKFKLGVKYCFEDVIQISESAHSSQSSKKNIGAMEPIFIIGVPRSGSTLVEKIIASGAKTIPMGEETLVMENFVNQKILQKQSINLGDADDLRSELFDIYKQKGLILEKNKNIFTDKSLNNFFYISLIKEIFPNAKVINCRRDALSSIVSIFKNNLIELAWVHDLENIFRYFDNYFRIVERFSNKYPKFIYELYFEKLVNNPVEETKKIMKFCNLSWDKKCLEFYKRRDLISKTASNIQIRKPIYKHSLDKYLPYKQLLEKYGKKYSWFN